MDTIKQWLEAIFGPSWIPSLLGYIAILTGAIDLIKEATAEGNFPTDPAGWALLLAGAIGTAAKQRNVTHAPIPLPEPKPAPEQSGIVITPPEPPPPPIDPKRKV